MAAGSWGGGGDTPCHPSAWCKANQGWVSVDNRTANGVVSIHDVKDAHTVYRLWKDGAAGNEYFLLENRQRVRFDASLPGGGLLVWHVDESQGGNTDENHYKVALMQADGKRDLEIHHSRGDAGDPYPGSSGNSSFNNTSTPNSKSYAGANTCCAVTGISASGPSMTANLQVKCVVVKPIKEIKEFKEHKEFKEIKEIEKKEHKDFKDKDIEKKEHKEFDKPILDNPGKPVIDKAGAFDKGPGDHKLGDVPGGGGGDPGRAGKAGKEFDKPLKEGKEHKDKDFKEHKEGKETSDKSFKEFKEHKDKDFKDKDKDIKDKEKDFKEHKEGKETSDKPFKDFKEHKDHKDKDGKDKEHKELEDSARSRWRSHRADGAARSENCRDRDRAPGRSGRPGRPTVHRSGAAPRSQPDAVLGRGRPGRSAAADEAGIRIGEARVRHQAEWLTGFLRGRPRCKPVVPLTVRPRAISFSRIRRSNRGCRSVRAAAAAWRLGGRVAQSRGTGLRGAMGSSRVRGRCQNRNPHGRRILSRRQCAVGCFQSHGLRRSAAIYRRGNRRSRLCTHGDVRAAAELAGQPRLSGDQPPGAERIGRQCVSPADVAPSCPGCGSDDRQPDGDVQHAPVPGGPYRGAAGGHQLYGRA